MMKPPKLFNGAVLAAALSLAAVPATAACPWPDNAAACSRWETLLKRLDAAAQRAEAGARPLAAAAAPAPSGPQEAQARAVINGLLRYLTPPLPDLGGFELDRGYTLSQQDGRYITTFAKAAWALGSDRVDFGPLTFQVQPQNPDRSLVDFRLGDVITITEDGQIQTRLLLGQQENQGTWSAALNNFATFRSRLANIVAVASNKPFLLEIAGIDLDQELSRNPDATWSGHGTFALKELAAQTDQQQLQLAGLSGRFSVAGRQYEQFANPQTWKLWFQDTPDPQQAARAAALYDLLSRSDVSMTATRLSLSQAQQPALQVGRLTFGSRFDEGDSSGSRLSYTLDLADLKTPPSQAPAQWLPTDVHLEIGLVNIPPHLTTRLMEINRAAEQLPEPERESYLQQQMSQLFLNSRLGMSIKDSYIKAPQARLDLSFQAGIDPQAAMGGIGEMIVRAEGLQKLLESSGAALSGQGGAGFLAMLVALSERTQDAGKVIDTFRLKLTPEGKLLLNDKDITALLAQPPVPPDQPALPDQPAPQKRP